MRRADRRYAILAVVLLSFIPALINGTGSEGRIQDRVCIDGIPLRGLTMEQAERALRRRAALYLSLPVELTCKDSTWYFLPAELGITVDWRGPLAQALDTAGQGSVQRLLALFHARHLGLRARLPAAVLDVALRKTVAPTVMHFARDAGPTGEGWRIDLAATGRNLRRAVLSPTNRRARLVLSAIGSGSAPRQPQLTQILATYHTNLAGSSPDRRANIVLGAARLNGILLRSGETFSFNTAVGPPDAAGGYRRAPEILRCPVANMGGGLGQVSSTLYNAVLLAGLPVLERANHVLPPGYVPLGRDAAVYYPWLDLKFANATPGGIMILASVEGPLLRLSLVGEFPSGSVTVTARIVERIDPPRLGPGLPDTGGGPAGAPGYRVRVTRLFGDPSRPTRTEPISEDVYHPLPRTGRIRSQRLPRRPVGRVPQSGSPADDGGKDGEIPARMMLAE